jgi:hypothetical protein
MIETLSNFIAPASSSRMGIVFMEPGIALALYLPILSSPCPII